MNAKKKIFPVLGALVEEAIYRSEEPALRDFLAAAVQMTQKPIITCGTSLWMMEAVDHSSTPKLVQFSKVGSSATLYTPTPQAQLRRQNRLFTWRKQPELL